MSPNPANWNEVVGDWYINGSGRLAEKDGGGGTADAVTISYEKVPARSPGEMYLAVDIANAVDGCIYIIYPACTNVDTVGPLKAVYYREGGDNWVVSIRNASNETLASGDIVASQQSSGYRAWVCCDRGERMIRAGMIGMDTEFIWVTDVDPGEGRHFGLGHNNETNGVEFDNFSAKELNIGRVICEPCWCYCDRNALPKKLLLTFYNTSGKATCLEDVTMVMDWENDAGTYTWFAEETFASGSYEQYISFRLRCGTWDEDEDPSAYWHFTLTFESSTCCTGNTGGCLAAHHPADGSMCVPLNLIFGQFSIPCSDLSCYLCGPGGIPPQCNEEGLYKIVITELPD